MRTCARTHVHQYVLLCPRPCSRDRTFLLCSWPHWLSWRGPLPLLLSSCFWGGEIVMVRRVRKCGGDANWSEWCKGEKNEEIGGQQQIIKPLALPQKWQLMFYHQVASCHLMPRPHFSSHFSSLYQFLFLLFLFISLLSVHFFAPLVHLISA